jgi:general secretion pathway protein L
MTTTLHFDRQILSEIGKKLLASEFMRWWLGELRALLPARMRATVHTAADFLPLPIADVASPPQNPERRPLALTLPAAQVLRKNLTLPSVTEENLRQVLEYQIDQLTPFLPAQVYFGYRVRSRNFDSGQIVVQLAVTPRGPVDQALKTLSESAVTVRALVAQDMLQAGELLDMLGAEPVKTASQWRQGVTPWLAGFVALLVLAALALPLVIEREAVVQLLPWVEKGKKIAEATDTLRRGLEAQVDQHNYLLEKKKNTASMLMALEEISRILPDNTWLQHLDVKGKEWVLTGETASSTKLIGLFEQSAMFHEASFRAPLTKGQAPGMERYQLAALWRLPAELAKEAPAAVAPEVAASGPVVGPSLGLTGTASAGVGVKKP